MAHLYWSAPDDALELLLAKVRATGAERIGIGRGNVSANLRPLIVILRSAHAICAVSHPYERQSLSFVSPQCALKTAIIARRRDHLCAPPYIVGGSYAADPGRAAANASC